jgi:hypothetical protein
MIVVALSKGDSLGADSFFVAFFFFFTAHPCPSSTPEFGIAVNSEQA